jgi:HlyD family secretion protein
MKKKFIIGGILLAIALVAAGAYYTTAGLAVEVLEVQPGTIANRIDEEGKIVPEVEYALHAPFGGEILELRVREGQTVQKDELLAVIDVAELEFQLRQLEAQLKALQGEEAQAYQDPPEAQINSQELLVEQARADYNMAEKELDRIQQLYEEGAATAQELEAAQNRLNSARIMLQQQLEALALLEETGNPTPESRQYYAGRREGIIAQIESLKHQLSKSKITAPIDGIIANLTVKEGDLVTPGLKLMTVFQPDSYQVETFVLAEHLEGIQVGMPVQLRQSRQGEDLSFSGKVTGIAPTAVEQVSALGLEEQRIKITISPDLPPGHRLLPGTVLDVEFITNEQEGVLAVPKAALFTYQNSDALWKVIEGKAQIQKVETGFENNSHVVITKGLEPGELVILNPQRDGLREGKNVSINAEK